MKNLNLFLYEGKHFLRSPFKVVALVLFAVAGLYGLHNGASLYHKQQTEIENIEQQVQEDRAAYLQNYEGGQATGNPTVPILAIWYSYTYHFKTPSPAMVYSIGQAEQYGFYKRVNVRASPYDNDMSEELANPERLQVGTLDFAFVLTFLAPLLLLLLVYNLKSFEFEQGFLPLIQVQSASKRAWLITRLLFYLGVVLCTTLILALYGAFLTDVFASESATFLRVVLYIAAYLFFWTFLFGIVLLRGNRILSNALTMVGVWLLLTLVVPASVNQWISLAKPVNLMAELVEVRDERKDIYAQPDSVILSQVQALFPEIKKSTLAGTKEETYMARNPGAYALVNELMKESIAPIEEDSRSKNRIIRSSYWFNPVTFFQNLLNSAAKTHFDDYQQYRDEIQAQANEHIRVTILDTWNDVKVDRKRYLEYYQILTSE